MKSILKRRGEDEEEYSGDVSTVIHTQCVCHAYRLLAVYGICISCVYHMDIVYIICTPYIYVYPVYVYPECISCVYPVYTMCNHINIIFIVYFMCISCSFCLPVHLV